ncbi:MAG: hypothetical protein QNJ94_09655 [Alphaproteobacteria bacterium]|nr:hypothetical protein [Alphaproteobacteria bacterium]
MSWRVGYPERFSYLDDEHEDLGSRLNALKRVSDGDETGDAKSLAMDVFVKLGLHIKTEEKIMQEFEYPERDLHEKSHQHLLDSIKTVLEFLDRESASRHRTLVAKHIENRILEELFLDRLLAEFLSENEAGG